MLPLSLLKTAQSHPMLVELKNGETYNGHLVSCDTWMNINLRDVICTSKDGDRFWRMPECYIRGSTIKYLRIPDEVIDMVKEDAQVKSRNRTDMKTNRSGGGNTGNPNQRSRQGNRNFNNRTPGIGGNRASSQGNRPLAQTNKVMNKN
ncbi:uncharacterized protein LOC129612471 [Condylostylus longicornis]|uniref:uncharacterized protein LOC129612471 n=1 Tax=Condylostylus longicornis TaxID=2530218 RepID=UPI00244E02A1|nr:uncharacterized protein LOC129612471 [Condylostylus longicornis]